jgi:predicted acylesterase/phospholipase RssA
VAAKRPLEDGAKKPSGPLGRAKVRGIQDPPEQRILVLQGGDALGAYQAGV